MTPIENAVDEIVNRLSDYCDLIDRNILTEILTDLVEKSKAKPLLSTAQMATLLGVIPSRVRQLSAELNVGTIIGGSLTFTDEDRIILQNRNRIKGYPKGRPQAKRRYQQKELRENAS